MRLTRMLALGASLLVLASACTTGGGSTPSPSATATAPPSATAPATPTPAPATPTPEPPKPTVRIGSAGFYEAQLVAEIYAQVLEADGFTVERHLGLGTRPIIEEALAGGQVDMLPEYIGSTLEFFNGGKGEASGDSAATAARLQEYYTPKGVTVLLYTPGQDQNGFAVRQETADAFSLARMSDLAAVAGQLVLGAPPECETNPVCLPGLKSVYGIEFKEFKPLSACAADGIIALNEKAIDVYEVCTTQPGIAQFGLVLLVDDKHLQPAENIAPVVRDDFLAKVPKPDDFKALLNSVSQRLTTDVLLELGVKVDVDKRDVADVATEWLKAEGVIP